MRHLRMPLKALLSMHFFIFDLDKSESITIVMKGGVHLLLIQKTGSLVPVNQENLRFGSRQP